MAEQGSILFVMTALRSLAEKQVKIIALDAVANLVEDTPRDTGWARSNWIPSIGRAVEGTTGAPDAVSGAAQAAGTAAIAGTYTLDKGLIYISNNVPYIQRLNDGHSKQAPAGFIQSSVLRAARGIPTTS